MSRLGILFFLMILLMPFSPGMTETDVPEGLRDTVIQGTDGITFAKNAPPSTIIVNYDELDKPQAGQVKFKMLTTKNGFGSEQLSENVPDYRKDLSVLGYSSVSEVPFPIVYYDSSETGAGLKRNEDNYFEGDLFQYRYIDAAKTIDGELLDVIVTYSNLHIFLETSGGDYQCKTYIALGDMLRTGNNYGQTSECRYGLIVDVKMQAVRKDGNKVDGTVLYAITDIDVNRSGTSFRNVYNAKENDNYTESVLIDRSVLKSKIYIPDHEGKNEHNEKSPGYKCIISPVGDNGIRFSAKEKVDDPDPGTYYSGFVTDIDNSQGLHITATTSGGYGWEDDSGNLFYTTVRTKLLKVIANPPLYHRIKSSSTENGTIEVDWQEEHSGAGTIVVMDGNDAVYTMEPKENARIYSLRIGDTTGDNDTKRLFSQSELLSMSAGNQKTVSIGEGRTGVLKCLGEGKYTFTFPDNNCDHRIHVVWEKLKDIEVRKVWDDAGHEAARPAQITVRLHSQGDVIRTAVLKASDGWGSAHFSGLPEKDAGDEGEKIDYTVTEDRIHNYIHHINEDQNPIVITNVYDPGKISLYVEKAWHFDKEKNRPGQVIIHLFADGVDTGKTLTLKASEHWYNEFEELDEFKAGNKIVYTIEEEAVPGYSGKVTGSAETGFVMVNTPSGNPNGLPLTGDSARPIGYLCLLALCGLGMYSCRRMKKR